MILISRNKNGRRLTRRKISPQLIAYSVLLTLRWQTVATKSIRWRVVITLSLTEATLSSRWIRALTDQWITAATPTLGHSTKEHTMGKGNNNRGNKESKKPKKEKAKVSATANSLAAKPMLATAKKKWNKRRNACPFNCSKLTCTYVFIKNLITV